MKPRTSEWQWFQSTYKVIPRVCPHWGDGFLADGARYTDATPRGRGCLLCNLLLQLCKHGVPFSASLWVEFVVSGQCKTSSNAQSLLLHFPRAETELCPYAEPLQKGLYWCFHSATARKTRDSVSATASHCCNESNTEIKSHYFWHLLLSGYNRAISGKCWQNLTDK